MSTPNIIFPRFAGIRCLMMPYIQGEADSVPESYAPWRSIIDSVFMKKGDIGFLTIDESHVCAGQPHRGQRAKYPRALHTEAGRREGAFRWGSGWGDREAVTLEPDVKILLSSNLAGSCAVWDAEHWDTSFDGDIGYAADQYQYSTATFLRAGEVREIGIATPHESIPVQRDFDRQFLRIVSSGVHGREPYFTVNPKVKA